MAMCTREVYEYGYSQRYMMEEGVKTIFGLGQWYRMLFQKVKEVVGDSDFVIYFPYNKTEMKVNKY